MTSVPQSNYCIAHFETCSWTKAEWSVMVWATSGQRRAHWFPKDLICPLSRPFPLHFLEKQSQSHICFQLTLPSWFSLAEVEKLASSGGKTRKQWWSIFSFTLAISMVPVRHYNCSWHFFFFSSHRIRLEIWVHLQFPKFLLHCAMGREAFITVAACFQWLPESTL